MRSLEVLHIVSSGTQKIIRCQLDMAAGKPWPILRSDQPLGDAWPIQPCSHSQDSFHTLLQPEFLFTGPEKSLENFQNSNIHPAITQPEEDGLVRTGNVLC